MPPDEDIQASQCADFMSCMGRYMTAESMRGCRSGADSLYPGEVPAWHPWLCCQGAGKDGGECACTSFVVQSLKAAHSFVAFAFASIVPAKGLSVLLLKLI